MRAAAFLVAAATAGIAAILPSGGARAALVLTASLSGVNEVPPNNSPGTGTASVTLENDNQTLDVSLAFSDLTSGALFPQINCCTAPGGNAPVVLPDTAFTDFPKDVTSGSYTTSIDLTTALTGISSTDFIAGLSSNLAYVDLHTRAFLLAGELRGFLTTVPEPVPEPCTAAMLVVGLAGIAGVRLKLKSGRGVIS
jgi:hypothetical protein